MHVGREVLSIEVVVPSSAFRHHKEAQELVGEDHLDLLKKGRRVLWRVRLSSHGSSILIALSKVFLSPVEALASQFIDTEGTRSCREAASSNDTGFGVPLRIVRKKFSVLDGCHGSQLLAFSGCCV